MEGYRTVKSARSVETVINKSRFIGHCAPARTADEALAFLGEVRLRHKEASHNCYAYIIGKNAGVMRYSDDGEPGGTAGMPIISTMRAMELVDVVVVVTRYFGGVLLGTGGLVRAYTDSCQKAIAAAEIVTMQPSCLYGVEIPYSLLGGFERYVESSDFIVADKQFAQSVRFELLIKKAGEEAFLKAVSDTLRAQDAARLIETNYYPWPA